MEGRAQEAWAWTAKSLAEQGEGELRPPPRIYLNWTLSTMAW
jgi:hypothetical protein